MEIKLASPEIQRDSVVDGEGIRSVIWTQGCKHHCPGCHNPGTHDFSQGFSVSTSDVKNEIKKLEGQDGITFSGGDPMEQPLACADIAKFCKELNLNVWCYTGYTFEELLNISKENHQIMDFLKYIDVLVDGRFVLKEKSYDVIFRGSKNQRLIDVRRSLEEGETILISKFDDVSSNKKGRKNHYMYV